jgi:hypothetical protein
VVSSSKNCAAVLQAAGIAELFEVRIDGMVATHMQLAGKPAPDTFLKAVEQLDVAPQRAVVVEDAISGVQAGRAGGFGLVIGIDRHGAADALRQNGTFVNGFHETWPIVYGEEAYGFAKTGQTMLNVTDSKIIKLYVDDEPFYLPTTNLLRFERRLDMQAGTLDREVLWETPSGKHVLLQSRRLVSFQHRHLAAIAYQGTPTSVAGFHGPRAVSPGAHRR